MRSSHAGVNGVIDAVVFAPASHGVIALIAFDKAKLRLHRKGIEVERLLRRELRHHEVGIVQQQTVSAQNQVVGTRFRVDGGSQIHSKILDDGFRFRINDDSIQRLFGDVEIRFQQQR